MLKKVIPLLICLLLCGCYDSTEIDDLAYVVAVGIDKGENEPYKISFQYAVPLNIGSGIDSQPGDEAPLTIYSFETSSVQMAASLANDRIAKITDLSHLKLVVFSEEIAKIGIKQLKTDFENALSARTQFDIAVCKDDAYSCLKSASSPLELNPSRYYEDFFDNMYSTYSVKQNTNTLFNDENVFSVPYLISDGGLSCSGMAVFKNYQMKDTFHSKEVLLLNLIKNEFVHLNFETQKGVFRLDAEAPPRFSISTEKVPKITISIFLTGEPVSGEEILFKDIKFSEDILKKELKSAVLEFLEHTQRINCDVLKLSSHAKRKFLTEQDFMKYNFEQKYKDAKFNINISFKNIRTNQKE